MKVITKVDQSERARQDRRIKTSRPGLRQFFSSSFFLSFGHDHPLPFPHHAISHK